MFGGLVGQIAWVLIGLELSEMRHQDVVEERIKRRKLQSPTFRVELSSKGRALVLTSSAGKSQRVLLDPAMAAMSFTRSGFAGEKVVCDHFMCFRSQEKFSEKTSKPSTKPPSSYKCERCSRMLYCSQLCKVDNYLFFFCF